MDSQIKLFFLLINLFFGIWVISFVYHRIRIYYSLYLKKVLQYVIVLNLFFLIIFVLKYFDINIWNQELSFKSHIILPYSFALINLTWFFLVYSMFEIYLAFKCKEIRKKIRWLTISTILILNILLFIGLNVAKVHPELRFLFVAADSLGAILILLEIIILILILTQKNIFCISVKVTRSFSILYLAKYLIVFLFSLTLSEPIGSSLTIFAFNLVSVVWIKSYVDKVEQKSIDSAIRDLNLNEIANQFKLSKRETEIFMMITEGKNNKEIQDELFISYHTVKNHVYNIFQKMNVKNRYQLINHISKKTE